MEDSIQVQKSKINSMYYLKVTEGISIIGLKWKVWFTRYNGGFYTGTKEQN
jgi:hypothetical protein